MCEVDGGRRIGTHDKGLDWGRNIITFNNNVVLLADSDQLRRSLFSDVLRRTPSNVTVRISEVKRNRASLGEDSRCLQGLSVLDSFGKFQVGSKLPPCRDCSKNFGILLLSLFSFGLHCV